MNHILHDHASRGSFGMIRHRDRVGLASLVSFLGALTVVFVWLVG